MKIQINDKTKAIRYICIAVHFCLTFLFERLFYREAIPGVLPSAVPKNNSISDGTEQAVDYLISKIFALILIALLWKLLFAVFQKRIDRKVLIVFGSVFLFLVVFQFFFWVPEYFFLVSDNCTSLASSIRFIPTYWHHIFTGCLYSAALMVAPFPFTIAVLQPLAFSCVLGYISTNTKIKLPILLIFLFPFTMFIAKNPYRNAFYGILCMFYFAYLIVGYFDKSMLEKE